MPTYLAREDTGSDCIYADLGADESSGEHTTEVCGSRLRACVCKLAVAATLHVSRNAADVDDL